MYLISVVLQIILESLPISSTGHLNLIGRSLPDYIDRLAQGPTVIVLLLYFYREILSALFDLKNRWRGMLAWLLLLAMANSVSVLVIVLFSGISAVFPLWLGFAITGLLLFSTRWCASGNDNEPDFMKVCTLGVVQGVAALISGLSRLGATYTVGCWLGFSPRVAFRISCAIQLPLIAAGFLEGLVSVVRHGTIIPVSFIATAAIVGAMIIAYLLLWCVEWLMVHNKIWYVGWYMLVPTLLAAIS